MQTAKFLRSILQVTKAGLRGPAVAVGRRSLLPRMWVPGSRAQTGATNPIRVQEVVRRPEYQEGEAVETPTAPVATGAKILDNRKVIEVQWDRDYPTYYPYLWLRDNCQCDKCFHPFTKARKLLMQELNLDAVPREVKVDAERRVVQVTWDDGHESPLPFDWLTDNNFTEHARQNRNALRNASPVLWGRELQGHVPRLQFPRVLENDRDLYSYLTNMELYGLCVLEDTPVEQGQVEKLAKRISFIRNCHYGEIHEVVAKAQPSNLAYTSGSLGLHTDFPFDRYPPGMLILHCIKQTDSEGGDSEYGDTFFVAEIMRRDYPDYFRTLTTTPVDFIDVGSDAYGQFSKFTRHPTFLLDLDGKVMRTHYSNQTRDSFLNIPIERVDPFLRALRKFDDLMYQNHITFKLKAGETVSFDNTRVLHGRKGFTVSATTEGTARHLESTFVDIDEINSKRRVLKQALDMHRFA